MGFVTKCVLRLNGWNDMGFATHEWLVAYVIFYWDVVAKPKMCCYDILILKNNMLTNDN